MADWVERLNRFVDSLQANRSPDRGIAATPDELEELRFAARLAGSRPESPIPNPEFIRGLRDELAIGPTARNRRTIKRSSLLRAAGLFVAGLAAGFGLDVALHPARLTL